MPLIDRLGSLIDDKGPGVIERMVESAKDHADDHLNGPEADIAKDALDRIADKADALSHLSRGAVVGLLTRWAIGDKDGSRETYLAEAATFEERRAASRAATMDAITERVNRERAWDEVRDLLQGLGKTLFRILPLLLAA